MSTSTPEQNLREYLGYLKKQSEVNRLIADHQANYDHEMKTGQVPLPLPEPTLEEMQADVNAERQRLIEMLRRSINPDAATAFVSGLVDEQISFLLTVFPAFLTEIKSFDSHRITPEMLHNLLNRFTDLYHKTKGIDIPTMSKKSVVIKPTDPDATRPLKDVLVDHGIATEGEALDFVSKLSAKELAAVDPGKFADYVGHFSGTTRPSLISLYRGYAGRKDITEREQAFIPKDTIAAFGDYRDEKKAEYTDLHNKSRDIKEALKNRDIHQEEAGILAHQLQEHKNDLKLLQEEYERLRRVADEESTRFADIEHSLSLVHGEKRKPIRKQKNAIIKNIENITAKIHTIKDDIHALEETIPRHSQELSRQTAKQAAAESRTRSILRPFGGSHEAMQKQKRSVLNQATAFPLEDNTFDTHQDYADPRFYGTGVRQRHTPPKYAEFGKHMIHLPSLSKGYLRIVFPSKAAHPKLPKFKMTRELQEVVMKALETGKIDARLIRSLSNQELRFLHKACEIAKVDHPIVLDEDEAELKRFEILRGEIQAGNDAPQIIKEMKKLIIKFLADGRISKPEGHRTLVELATLENF